jgi:hypothetical protein
VEAKPSNSVIAEALWGTPAAFFLGLLFIAAVQAADQAISLLEVRIGNWALLAANLALAFVSALAYTKRRRSKERRQTLGPCWFTGNGNDYARESESRGEAIWNVCAKN